MNRKLGTVAIAGLPAVVASAPAHAVGLKEIGGNMDGALRAWAPVLIAFAFLGGLWFFIQGWIKLKNHKEDPRDNSMAAIVMHIVGGGALMFISGMATVFSDTLGVDNATSVGGYGSFTGVTP